MGILSRAGDLAYTLRFLRLLTTKFEDTTAYKLGLIDEKGNKIKKAKTPEEKSAYNAFHRLVFNLKKLLAKVPGGSSKFASYISALFLIKEHLQLSDKSIDKIVERAGIDPLGFLDESTQWFVTEDSMLSPGKYKIATSKLVNSTCEELCAQGDTVIVDMDNYPIGESLGVPVYEVTHLKTKQMMYVTTGELRL
jgi:hypothetical protein